MTTRVKSILIYLGGIATGIILAFAFFFLVAWSNVNASSNDNIVMFDKPQQEIEAESFKVMQVLPDRSALATVEGLSNYGTIVMFLADEESSYYDDQKIEVPKNKRVMQIGTYRYMTMQKMGKTVPIVEIMDR